MERFRLQVDGMTCTACEAMIKIELQTHEEVSCVNVDWQAETVDFFAADVKTANAITCVIEDLGYGITTHARKLDIAEQTSPELSS